MAGPEQEPEQGGRVHEKSATFIAGTRASAELDVVRGMNADRITLLSVLLGVALTIAFGIEGLSWWQRVTAGVLSFAGAALVLHVLFSHERSTHGVMFFAHRVLGRKL